MIKNLTVIFVIIFYSLTSQAAKFCNTGSNCTEDMVIETALSFGNIVKINDSTPATIKVTLNNGYELDNLTVLKPAPTTGSLKVYLPVQTRFRVIFPAKAVSPQDPNYYITDFKTPNENNIFIVTNELGYIDIPFAATLNINSGDNTETRKINFAYDITYEILSNMVQ